MGELANKLFKFILTGSLFFMPFRGFAQEPKTFSCTPINSKAITEISYFWSGFVKKNSSEEFALRLNGYYSNLPLKNYELQSALSLEKNLSFGKFNFYAGAGPGIEHFGKDRIFPFIATGFDFNKNKNESLNFQLSNMNGKPYLSFKFLKTF